MLTLNSQYDSFLELHKEDFKIKTTVLCKNSFQNKSINKIIRFVYTNIMKFPKNAFVTDVILSNNFLANVCNIIFGREVIHHSHIAGEIIGYAHNFCNQKVRQNKNQISVIAHNLFGFDYIFLFKRSKARALANNKLVDWCFKLNKHKLRKYWRTNKIH